MRKSKPGSAGQLPTRGILTFQHGGAAELEALAADIRAVEAGFGPSEAALAQALFFEGHRVDYRYQPCLVGNVDGQIMNHDLLWLYAPGEGWARTLRGGFVRLDAQSCPIPSRRPR